MNVLRRGILCLIIFTLLMLSTPQIGSAATWTLSYASPVDVITTLAVYNGKLFAGGHSNSQSNARLFAYDGSTWSDLNFSTSIGIPVNMIESLQEFNNRLYIGVRVYEGSVHYSRVYYYDGTAFTEDFSTLGANWCSGIDDMTVHNNTLFAANGACSKGEVFQRLGDNNWISMGGKVATSGDPARALASYKGSLYVGTGAGGNQAKVWRWTGSSWELSANIASQFGISQDGIWSMAATEDHLYAGTAGSSTSGVIAAYDGSSWTVGLSVYKGARLAVINNQIWAGTMNGNIYWNNGSWQAYGAISNVYDFSEYLGYIYAASSTGKVYRLESPNGYSITGNIRDLSGNAIPNVKVSTPEGYTTVSNSNGSYTLGGLGTGIYTITPHKNGYAFSPASLTVNVETNSNDQDFVGSLDSWTLLFYMAGDNEIDQELAQEYINIRNAEQHDINLVVFRDSKTSGTSYNYIPSRGVQIKIEKGNLNSGDGTTLSDFILWSKQNYPAAHYALIISDHGHALGGVAQDVTANDIIRPKELQQALSLAGQIDVLYLNTCLMGNLDIAYQLRGLVDFIVASEAVLWGPVWHGPYISTLSSSTLSEDLAEMMAKSYFQSKQQRSTISVVDMAYVEEVAQKVSALASAVQSDWTVVAPQVWNIMTSGDLQRFDENSDKLIDTSDRLADLYHFAELTEDIPELETLSRDLLNTKNNFIVFSDKKGGKFKENGVEYEWNYDHGSGITITLPTSSISFYILPWLDLAQGSAWNVDRALLPSREGELQWGAMVSELVLENNQAAPDNPNPPEPIAPFMNYSLFMPLIISN